MNKKCRWLTTLTHCLTYYAVVYKIKKKKTEKLETKLGVLTVVQKCSHVSCPQTLMSRSSGTL